jgi:alkaline phosphatase D
MMASVRGGPWPGRKPLTSGNSAKAHDFSRGRSQIAGYQQSSYPGRVTGGQGVAQGGPFGVGFMTPALTSVNVAEALHLTRGLRNALTFDREECRYVAYTVDKTEDSPDANREVLVAYRVPEEVVDLEDVTEEHQ